MDLRDLGQRIRLRREKRGLKQNDVARALQVSPQAVSKWERGENAPDIALFVPLCKLLGVSVDWLLGAHVEDVDVFEATVFFSGVSDAREMSESLSPRQFATWTNAVCYQVTEAVLACDGVPIKFQGPGILCFFSGAEHGRRAVQAALSAGKTATAPLKIGLCTGQIYLGQIGHPDYAQSDIMGEAVSIARLAAGWAAQNTASGIAISAADVAGVAEGVSIGPGREVSFTGISHAVTVYEVSDADSPMP